MTGGSVQRRAGDRGRAARPSRGRASARAAAGHQAGRGCGRRAAHHIQPRRGRHVARAHQGESYFVPANAHHIMSAAHTDPIGTGVRRDCPSVAGLDHGACGPLPGPAVICARAIVCGTVACRASRRRQSLPGRPDTAHAAGWLDGQFRRARRIVIM